MAAELHQLIAHYRAHGLEQAADVLGVVQAGMMVENLIPAQLDTAANRAPERSPLSADNAVLARRGRRGEGLDLSQVYELDTLDLPKRQRNALLRWGVGTIADLQAASEEGWLSGIRYIGRRNATQIAATLRERTRTDA